MCWTGCISNAESGCRWQRVLVSHACMDDRTKKRKRKGRQKINYKRRFVNKTSKGPQRHRGTKKAPTHLEKCSKKSLASFLVEHGFRHLMEAHISSILAREKRELFSSGCESLAMGKAIISLVSPPISFSSLSVFFFPFFSWLIISLFLSFYLSLHQ